MANRIITHAVIVDYFRNIAKWHKEINGFYRFNWIEIENALRAGINEPTLLLESHDSAINPNGNQTATFNERTISFMLLKYADWDDFEKQEQVLDDTEKIALDICSLLDRDRKNPTHWLCGNFNGNLDMDKVGPVFDNRFGWNIIIRIKNKEPMCFDVTKWDFD